MRPKSKRIQPIAGYVKYLRTSDEDVQAPERSQAGQRRDIQRLLIVFDLPDRGEYVDNFTGTSADRHNYQRMLSDARQGKFSHVFASVPDRFGRDDVEALRAIDELTALGVTVRFASHPDLEPANEDDRLYLNILFGMAKREAAVIARRCRNGMLSKLLDGGWSWRAPDGFVNKEIRLTELGKEEQLKHAKYKRWVEQDPQQAKVWRYAWDLLLKDKLSLAEICEALYERGYHLRDGRPFVKISKTGKRRPCFQTLSRSFHNWFYAGWIVVENDWANIAPKTVRGQWDPIVSTEEFEQGLAILARRSQTPTPDKRHFYLLQGLVYLETSTGELRKLTCSKPNANRFRGGVEYYCIPSSNINFLCHQIDAQLPSHLQQIQVDPDVLPAIRQTYAADITRFTSNHGRELLELQTAQKRLDEKEVNLWRAFTEHGTRANVYEQLAQEYEDERKRLKLAIEAIKRENGECIANLNAALAIIADIAERYLRQERDQQREILRQMVKRVVINSEGKIVRIEWKPPFMYLHQLTDGNGGKRGNGREEALVREEKRKTSTSIAGSFYIDLGSPNGAQGRKTILGRDLFSAKKLLLFIHYYEWIANPPFTLKDRNTLIRTRHADGESISRLALEYGISNQRVHQIIRNS